LEPIIEPPGARIAGINPCFGPLFGPLPSAGPYHRANDLTGDAHGPSISLYRHAQPLSTRTPQLSKIAPGAGQATSADGTGSTGFSGELSNALKSVSAAQNKATQMQQEVQLENPAVSLEDTMIAIQKAQIGFRPRCMCAIAWCRPTPTS
jgi:flagellar hook-basal body complex protein FliE